MKKTLSIKKAFSGKQILLAGASGFVGKVWLSMMLERLPEIEKIYVLIRKKGKRSGLARFESMLNTSPVFQNLHEKHGKQLSSFLRNRVEVLEGDVSQPNLGISEETALPLQKNIDLFINCAGLVDFYPELRLALAVNVEGPLHALSFVQGSTKAALLHVSTCYVAGTKEGRIPETLDPSFSPSGQFFDSEKEYLEIKSLIEKILSEKEDGNREKEIQHQLLLRKHQGKHGSHEMTQLLRRRLVRDQLINEGTRRAQFWGWPNTYTYTKSLAESLLVQRAGNTRMAILRPSIVESSLSYPFPGWNEGFNTCGPLVHLLGTWFRHFTAKKGNPFDVIPVDFVGNGLGIAGAELLTQENSLVYHCGSSGLNPITIDCAAELTSKTYQKYYKQHGKTWVERNLRSRWKNTVVDFDYPLGVPKLRQYVEKIMKGVTGLTRPIPTILRNPLDRLIQKGERIHRKLQQVEKTLLLFKPYVYDYYQIFETQSFVSKEIEEKEFAFALQKMDWKKYWCEIHMPGLRKWCFPKIEGRAEEVFHPEFPVHLSSPSPSREKRETLERSQEVRP